MKRLRKALTITVMMVTVLSMSMVAVPLQANAAAQAGDLIKMSGLSSVYYLGGDGKRYVFPNEQTYFSWYSDFSSVVTIPQSELESYSLGANVTIRPGTKLVKITTDPKVYAVESDGTLKHISSEATAIALYGANWAKRVVDVPDAFFTNYTVSTGTVSATAYPEGSLIKAADASDVYYIASDGTARKIASEAAFTANRFKWSDIIITTLAIPTVGTGIAAAESVLIDTSSGAGGVAGAGTGLTVSLASDTTPSSTVVAGSAANNLASFTLTAANDGAVKVTTIKVTRVGISGDTTLPNIYLYEGNVKLTDAGSLSTGVATFSSGAGIISIPAGQTKTITVKADILVGATGQTLGVSIKSASDIVTDGAAISGSFPVSGNLMSVASISDPAMVAIGVATGAGLTIQAGSINATVWQSTLDVQVRKVDLKLLTFKQIGSAPSDAIQNITLYVRGEKKGSAVSLDSESRATFDLSASPATLETGNNTVEVRADIVKGSSRTFSFSLQTVSDATMTDTNYNFNVLATGSAPFGGGTTTISPGSVSVSADSTFSTTQVVKNAPNATLARYTMKAFGEDMKVQTLTVIPTFGGTTANTEGINNLFLFVDNAQVGSSQNYIKTIGNFPADPVFGTTNLFTVKAGQTVKLEIRGTLNQLSATGITTIGTALRATADAYQGQTSFVTSPTLLTTYTGNPTLQIITGALTLSPSTDYQSQNTLANVVAKKIGSYKLQAGSAENVRVTNIAIGLATSTVPLADLSNIYISENTTPLIPQTNNNFPVNFTIDKNTVKTIDVFADIGNAITGSTTVTYLTVTATGVSTNNSVGGSVQGQTLTVQTGTLATPTLVSNEPSAKLVVGGATETIATYKFVATNGNAVINELKVNIVGSATTTPNATAVSSITVGSITAPVVLTGGVYQAYLTGLNLTVPAGTAGLLVAVKPTYNSVTSTDQGGSATRNQVGVNLAYYKHTIANVVTEASVNVASNVMVLVASAPTVELAVTTPKQTTTANPDVGGNMEVLHFTVTTATAPINLKAVGFTPVFGGALTSTSTQLVRIYDSNDLNTVLGSASIGNSASQGTVSFTSDYLITASVTKTFVVKVDTTGLSTTGNTFRLDLTVSNDTGVSTGTNWQWNDSTATTYGNGYLVKNLPKTGNTFTK
ncbi:hypothetical protein L6249_02180 [Candidatus Parcubacteria bacterium]|nr:hypothetical protein [Patescibacteria group bacterium]MCG2690855.1 hypothetical protein [Candidatus Parcubacteria bacterium]